MTDTATPRPARIGVPDHITAGVLAHMRANTTQQVDHVMTLPEGTYSDPAIAHLERTKVFSAVPFIAAFWSELARPGDFIVKQLPSNHVIIARGHDGVVRTFVNKCRHRGATVKIEATGSCRAFSCPYHGWTYGLDGGLEYVTAPESFGEFDTASHGLVALPTQEHHGFIWVVEDPAATIDVAAWLGPDTEAHFAQYAMQDMVCFRVGAFDEPVNWKVMQDAFLDGYHIPFVHTRSANRIVRSNTYVMEDFGRHTRFCSPRRTFEQWMDHDPEPGTPMADHLMLTHYIAPNCTLLQLRDNFQTLHFTPIGDDPNRCIMEMRLIVPKVEDSGMDEAKWEAVWEKNWHILQDVLVQEDFPVLRGIQSAHQSAVPTTTMLGRNEIANQAFHREVQRLIRS